MSHRNWAWLYGYMAGGGTVWLAHATGKEGWPLSFDSTEYIVVCAMQMAAGLILLMFWRPGKRTKT